MVVLSHGIVPAVLYRVRREAARKNDLNPRGGSVRVRWYWWVWGWLVGLRAEGMLSEDPDSWNRPHALGGHEGGREGGNKGGGRGGGRTKYQGRIN